MAEGGSGVPLASGSAVVVAELSGDGVVPPGDAVALADGPGDGEPGAPVGLAVGEGVGLAVTVALGSGSSGAVSSGATGPVPGGGGSYFGRSGSSSALAFTVSLLWWPMTSMKMGPRSNAISWPDSS